MGFSIMLGQIHMGTGFGKNLYKLVLENNFKNIVDVGTWNGLGTTSCILKALDTKQAFDTNLYTVELYQSMVEQAIINLSKYLDKFNIHILHGKICNIDEVYDWFDHSSIDFVNDEHAKLWYHKDMQLLKQANNVIDLLPESIDFLVLDGGEYSTYPEWQKLKNRTKFFALDDTNILKCSRIRQEILSRPEEYQIVYDITTERNGYLIGRRNV